MKQIGLPVIGVPAGDTSALEKKVDASVASLRTDMSTLDSKVSTLESKVDILEDKVGEISSELWYGIEFDTTVSSPECTRIGSSALHRTLPIHNRMRGCLLNDEGKVVEYLDPQDWTGNVRDGSRGQVMVEIPRHYRKFETDGNKRRVKLAESPLPGFAEVPLMYVSAYEASLQHSTNKLCSVVNDDADYRGGNNKASYDGTYRSLLNRPATMIRRANFRNYARKRKAGSTEWNCLTYNAQKAIYWFFVVEYATLNVQAAYNSEPTAEGFRQGGLGAGATNMTWEEWNKFNGCLPVVPCGFTDSLGNRTGVVEYTINNEAESNPTTKTIEVIRYRGVENPFGHIWMITDGINVRISPNTENGGDGLSKVFVCSDPSKFSDSNYEGYSHVGNEARSAGYVKEVIFGEGGEIIPKVVGVSSTTYFCEGHYTSIPSSGEVLNMFLAGSSLDSGADAGLGFFYSSHNHSYSETNVGSRLCFIPATA